MRYRTGVLTVIMVIVLLMTAGYGLASGVIRIGVAGPHSGDLTAYGLPALNAVRIIANKYNAVGGVLGKQIEVLTLDDQCNPAIAASFAYNLVADGVDVVVGHICSGATNAAMGIYRDANVVAMSPSATDPALTQSGDYPNFFRTIASDDTQARLEVDFAIDVLKLKKIAVLHDNGDYGKGLAEFAKGSRKNNFAELALGFGSGLVDPREQNHRNSVLFRGFCD